MPRSSARANGEAAAQATSEKPNVIVFFTDQQRWDSTGVHGNPLDLTPNFDRMARQGTHLHTTVTCQPVCGPARSCLQTGMYATTTGCFRNAIPLPQDARTLAHFFGEGGYDTGYIGKWHLADRGVAGPVPEANRGGYQSWLASNALEFTSDAYDTVMYDNEGAAVKLPGYRVDALTDAAIRYVDDHQQNPFFLFLSYIEPHHQNHIDDYPPPDGYRERYAGRWTPPDLLALGGSSQQHLGGYWGMIKRLDEALGRLLDALKSLGLDENTIVLYTTDHGCHFKTRNDEYKRSCHEAVGAPAHGSDRPRLLRRRRSAGDRQFGGSAADTAGRSRSGSARADAGPFSNAAGQTPVVGLAAGCVDSDQRIPGGAGRAHATLEILRHRTGQGWKAGCQL